MQLDISTQRLQQELLHNRENRENEILELDNLEAALDRLLAAIKKRSVPGALLVRGGVID